MEYPVVYAGASAGKVRLTEEGSRVCLEMDCPGNDSGLFRGFLICRGGELPLGVLEPKGQRLYLRRLLYRAELERLGAPVRGELRLSFPFRRQEGWQRVEDPRRFFRRTAFGQGLEAVEDALWCEARGLRYLALPFDCRRPFLLSCLFCFARIHEIGGRSYAVFAFDQEENPVMTNYIP